MPQIVLLIHDDGTKAQVVKDALIDTREGFFLLEWVERCSEAVQRLRRDGKEHIAAILVNLFLPDSHGVETFDRLFEISPDVPILVLSGPGHEDAAKLAVRRGAQDYLLEIISKVTCYPRLCAICSSARRTRRPCSERKSAHR